MQYRREIDGLRAIAIISVVFFHAGFDLFKGGFVGVDIFFVISGFLMTSIILREKEEGIFTLKHFYERRIRRIFPMLFFLMAICFIPAFYLLTPKELIFFTNSASYSAIAISNILFAKQTMGYFDTSTDLIPLIHTWTLSVEEQFYLVIPIIFIFCWKFGKKNIFYILCLLIITSLIATFTTTDVAKKFYLLPYRFWELGVGSLIAFLPKQKKSEVLSLLGLILILISIFILNERSANISLFMLLPCLGTALVIIFGSSSFTSKLLSYKPFTLIGLTSYSAYLIHQPLFAFFRTFKIETLNTLELLFLSFATFPIAFCTWKIIETPFRKKSWISIKSLIIISITFIIMFKISIIITNYNNGFPNRFNLDPILKESFAPPFVDESKCEFIAVEGTKDKACYIKLGNHDKNQTPNYVLIGNSLSLVFVPILEKLNLQGFLAYSTGQMVLLSKHSYINTGACENDNVVCDLSPQTTFEFIKKKNIKRIFIIASWDELLPMHAPYKYHNITTLEEDLEYTIKQYSNIGIHVYIIQQNPFQTKFVGVSVMQFYQRKNISNKAIRAFSIKQSDYKKNQEYVEDIFLKYKNNPHVTFIRFDDILCDSEVCPVGTTEEAYYYDRKHITASGSRLIEERTKKYFLSK